MASSVQTVATSTGSLFSYDFVPLSDPSTEIRLLDLLPAANYTDDLYCCIYTAPISQAPSYIALSYVWGDGTRSHKISVANEVNNGRAFVPLPLTSSLDTCLRHLRYLQRQRKFEPRPLWIDQICINQEDDAEKSSQVLLMKDIYSFAGQVIVWLGPTTEGSDKVMDTFAELGQGFLDKVGDHTTEEHLLSLRRLIKQKIDQPGVVAFLRKAFKVLLELRRERSFTRLMERPWFTRVWTIQEFCLCPNTFFACGYKVVPETFFSAVNDFTNCIVFDSRLRERLSETPDNTPTFSVLVSGFIKLAKLFQRRAHCQFVDQKENLEHLLVEFYVGSTPSYATDRRDRVYGLLGLAGDADELGIVPDYSASSTVGQVLTQTARAIIEKKWRTQRIRGLYILRYGSLGRQMSESGQVVSSTSTNSDTELVPSWVPEWNNETIKTWVAVTTFAACGKDFRTADLLPTSSPNVLGIRGFSVDTIVDLGEQIGVNTLHFPDGPKKIPRFFESLKRLLDISKQNEFATKDIYATPAQHDSALWRVPIGDQYIAFGIGHTPARRADSTLESVYRKFIAYYEDYGNREEDWNDYLTAYRAGEREASLSMERHMDELLAEGYYLAMGNMRGKRPFLTKNGYLGMCPGHSQPGDKVVVFHGDVIPYVVRSVPERGENMYLLVGEAYCDGIMDGELAERAEREEFYLV